MGSVENLLATVKIKELPRRRVSLVSRETTLAQVHSLLVEEHSVAVLICEDQQPVGIFTERDVLNRTVLEGDPETPIGELMSSIEASLERDDRLADAIELMTRGGYRHVPLRGAAGKEPGLIGGRDILRLIAEYYPETLLNLPPRLDQKMTAAEGG